MGLYLLDQYSLLHFCSGIIVYFTGIRLDVFIFLHFIFEYLENTYYGMDAINTYLIWFWPGRKNRPDSLINSISDIVFGVLGWKFAEYADKYFNKEGAIVIKN